MSHFLRNTASWVLLICLVVIVIAANSAYTIHTLGELESLERRLFTTNKVINSINTLHVAILRAESGQRGYLLTQQEDYLSDYEKTLNRVNRLIEQVEENAITSDYPVQEARLEQLIDLSKVKLKALIEVVELAREGQLDQAMTLFSTDRGLLLYDEFETLFVEIDQQERQLQNQHIDSLMKLRADSITNLIISAVTTTLLIVGIFFLLRMNIRDTISYQRDLQQHNMVLESKVKERTAELQVFAEELSRSNRELEDFAFVASHDLQEPLRKIRAFGNRISTGYESVMDERGQDFLRRMLNAAERMSMLISDLLAFSRVTTRGKDFTSTDLNSIVASVLDDLEIKIEETSAVIELDDLPTIQADTTQMNQLFLNLLSNALKFVKPDTTPHISVRYASIDETNVEGLHLLPGLKWFKITLQDNGIGFEQSFAEKIFAPFQRLHGRSEYQGTGIGLAVCRRIVERHNGTIQAFGEPQQGARFEIYLPEDGQPFTSLQQQGVISRAEQ
ncbi:sensor histidine kinase [Alteromonas gilva]|uniref:histidine kinase n=1 Tax=Alteromonas gilva TaxID=2987522 RepID=A0ABT5L0Y0_9ALTE|nr:sensor histidine kinase [Alteromonas gilva]MDC8830703.1 CHASE3 domain-containing protein [Alteromonas gilva]